MHEISINQGGEAEAVFAGKPAWHGLGESVPEHVTVWAALEQAQLNWTVDQVPILRRQDASEQPTLIDTHVANVRSDDGRLLGVVGKDYVPIQHAEQATFIEALLGEGEGIVECLGALREGRRQFWTIRLPGNFQVGERDHIKRYLIATNGHDGTLAFRVFWSSVRVVCSNTLSIALRDAPSGVALRHTSKVKERIDEARHVLGLADAHYRRLGETFEELASVEIGDREAEAFMARVFPFPPKPTDRQRRRVERTREQVLTNFMGGVGSELSGTTPWGGARPQPPFKSRMRYRMMRWGGKGSFMPRISHPVEHGDVLKLADREWFVLHTPGHWLKVLANLAAKTSRR